MTIAGVAAAVPAYADDPLTFDIDGYVRYGLNYNDARDDETIQEFRLRVIPKIEWAVSDTVTLGYKFQYQVDENRTHGGIDFEKMATSAPQVYAKVDKWEIAYGNTDGALNRAPWRSGYEPGLTFPINHGAAIDYRRARLSWEDQSSDVLYVGYGGFRDTWRAGVSVSTNKDVVADGGFDTFDEEASAFVSYRGDNYQVSLAYSQGLDDQSLIMATGQYSFDKLSLSGLLAWDDVKEDNLSGMAYGLSARYQLNKPTRIEFMYGGGTADDDREAYGIGASYRFDSGLTLRGSVFHDESRFGERTLADLGVIYFF